MSAARALALTAALLMGAPQPASAGRVIWVGLCDAAHPGTQLPIPLDPDGGGAPAKACHAGCFMLAERQARGQGRGK